MFPSAKRMRCVAVPLQGGFLHSAHLHAALREAGGTFWGHVLMQRVAAARYRLPTNGSC